MNEDYDIRDELSYQTALFGEETALQNITNGMVKQDNVECCICLNFNWGVKLPNCNHFLCPKCYYKIYCGYISSDFLNENIEPEHKSAPIYPYKDAQINDELFHTITNDETHLEWFVEENEDFYNSVKMKSEFVKNVDIKIKRWFKNNKVIKQHVIEVLQYEKWLTQFYDDMTNYNQKYDEEKHNNAQKSCPMCRL